VVARERQTEVGYFVCEERSNDVGERDTWSRVKEGKSEESLRRKSLFTVCQRRLEG